MSELIFGQWGNRWGWRVEWMENGVIASKDFYQEELKPGKDKEDANAFRLGLGEEAA